MKRQKQKLIWEAMELYQYHMLWHTHWPAPNQIDLREAHAVRTALAITLRWRMP